MTSKKTEIYFVPNAPKSASDGGNCTTIAPKNEGVPMASLCRDCNVMQTLTEKCSYCGSTDLAKMMFKY